MCGSPRLIAACHVLRRLFAPRHPPYALSSLTIKLTQETNLKKTEVRRQESERIPSNLIHRPPPPKLETGRRYTILLLSVLTLLSQLGTTPLRSRLSNCIRQRQSRILQDRAILVTTCVARQYSIVKDHSASAIQKSGVSSQNCSSDSWLLSSDFVFGGPG